MFFLNSSHALFAKNNTFILHNKLVYWILMVLNPKWYELLMDFTMTYFSIVLYLSSQNDLLMQAYDFIYSYHSECNNCKDLKLYNIRLVFLISRHYNIIYY